MTHNELYYKNLLECLINIFFKQDYETSQTSRNFMFPSISLMYVFSVESEAAVSFDCDAWLFDCETD